ncbi:MAG: NAD(P)/FAD-dependent oxidoreductase [Pseudomonadota bacterium]
MPRDGASTPHLDVIVVGAGFAGLCAGYRLKKGGREDFEIWEKADAVGGTWRDNTYPGCACDVPSHLYSFSFALNPDWSRAYSPAAEIKAYLERCTDEFDLRRHIRFGTELVHGEWDEEALLWRVRAADGREATCRALIVGQGPLNKPAYHDIPGGDDFEGLAFHSMHWPEDLDVAGKRVAVIGTGASAIQFVPWLAERAAELTVFQRTPPWILPKLDRAFPESAKEANRSFPLLTQLRRWLVYGALEWRALAFTMTPGLMKALGKPARDHLAAQVTDPELRAKLTPDYVIGCKRVLISNDYYPAIMRDNVRLETTPLARITERGVETAKGERVEADILVYGTGFRATDLTGGFDLVGEGGRRLHEDWADDEAEAYYGVCIAGYPNLFYLVGPNTGLGHNSIVFMIESQMNLVMDALKRMDQSGARAIRVRDDVQKTHNSELQERLKRTVWATGCSSWYQTKSGKNVTLWPGFTIDYRAKTKRLRARDFEFLKAPAIAAE